MMRTFAENLQSYDQVVEVRCNGMLSSGSVSLSVAARCSRQCRHTKVASFRSALDSCTRKK